MELLSKSQVLAQHGTIAAAARAMGIPRKTLADRLEASSMAQIKASLAQKVGFRITLDNLVGSVIVFSDLHVWPGERSVGFEAMLRLIPELHPVAIVNNGDAFDGARISRHPPTGWAGTPSVEDELNACIDILEEVEASVKETPLLWNHGNHDSRFSVRLATTSPEYAGVHGTDLKHHFPAWQFGWSTLINGHTMVKHRYSGGVHATYSNVLKAGVSVITGHLHSQKVTPYTDYRGTRYGVDTGTLADWPVGHDKATWTEDNPLNWRSGFAVLTFDGDGDLLPPELVTVHKGRVYFRGREV